MKAKEPEKKWMPKIGGKYYTITNSNVGSGVHKHIWEGSKLDYARHETGDCFKSKKAANWTMKMFGDAW